MSTSTRRGRTGTTAWRRAREQVAGDECWLCGEPIDRSLRWPDERSFSVDHIVPVSLGGSDELANLAPAHLLCNQRRGDGVARRTKSRAPDAAKFPNSRAW